MASDVRHHQHTRVLQLHFSPRLLLLQLQALVPHVHHPGRFGITFLAKIIYDLLSARDLLNDMMTWHPGQFPPGLTSMSDSDEFLPEVIDRYNSS